MSTLKARWSGNQRSLTALSAEHGRKLSIILLKELKCLVLGAIESLFVPFKMVMTITLKLIMKEVGSILLMD